MFTQMPSDIFIYTIFAGGEKREKEGEEENILWFYQKSTKGTLSSLSEDADVVNFYSRQILAENTVE